MLRTILNRLAREPVLLRNAIAGIAAVVAVFGVTVGDATLDTIIDAAGLAVALLISASARQKVTPV